jgi:chromosome segregation ATPase
MTNVDQSLLQAIRVVVGEAVAPLGEKIDRLTERVDGLTERVDGLTERVDGLTERVDGLTERVDRIETEQHAQRLLLEGIGSRLSAVETRLISIEDRVSRLEQTVERLETRTGQLSRELFDLQDRMERGFASIKSETTLALKDLGAIKQTQQADQKKLRQLEKKVALLQQRLEALENAQAAQSQ